MYKTCIIGTQNFYLSLRHLREKLEERKRKQKKEDGTGNKKKGQINKEGSLIQNIEKASILTRVEKAVKITTIF